MTATTERPLPPPPTFKGIPDKTAAEQYVTEWIEQMTAFIVHYYMPITSAPEDIAHELLRRRAVEAESASRAAWEADPDGGEPERHIVSTWVCDILETYGQ